MITSEVGRPTIGRVKRAARVTVTDSSVMLTAAEREQLLYCLDHLAKHGHKIRSTDNASLWATMADKLRPATTVRFETVREVP